MAERAIAASASGGIWIDSASATRRRTVPICSTVGRWKSKRWQRSTTVAGTLPGLGGGEHEHGVRRRLLEGLQERVPGGRREHVGLVEDVDLAPPADGRVGDALTQLADVLDRVVRGGVHLEHVQRARPGDRHARLATPAGLGGGPFGAVQAGGEDLRHRGLAGAAGADEQVGVVNLVPLDRVAERPGRPAPGPRPPRRYAGGACDKATVRAVKAPLRTPWRESTHAGGQARSASARG